jgi:phosphatidate cytidylyltransferase
VYVRQFAAVIAGAVWLVVLPVFFNEEALNDAMNRIIAGFAVLIYPGLFMAWIVKMSALPHSGMIILIFLLIVVINDSAAWAVGILFGKGSRGYVKASPNKSLAGFAGGIILATLIGTGTVFLFPEIFTPRHLPPPVAGTVLGLLSAAAATLGDLGESAMKRSADIKDSGSIIPGRGGVLDSIDSISITAPVYYLSYYILFIANAS